MKTPALLGVLALALAGCSLAADLTPSPAAPPTEAPLAATRVVEVATAAAPESPLTEQIGTVTGQVRNGTLDAGVEAGWPVTLHGFDAHGASPATATTLTTTTTTDGLFQFDSVPFSASRSFVVTTVFGQATYASDMLAFGPGQAVLDTTLLVYEGTTEAAALRVDQVHTFVEFAADQAVTVGQLYVFSNDGNATYGADGQARLHFALPAGATDISVQGAVQGENLFGTGTGFDLAQPVTPGSRTAQVLLSFSLPYAGELEYEQALAYPVDSLNVLITDLSVTIDSPSLQALGVQASAGMQFQNFEQAGLAAGEALRFRLSGTPATTTTAAGAPVSEPVTTPPTRPWVLITGLGGLGVGLVVAGGWLYFRRAPAAKPAASREALLRALVELDERWEAAQIEPADYQLERDRLKHQLKEQWS